jgi:transposase
MKKSRRKFSAEFKARVALEAARGVKTINEIAADNELHPVQVSQWKGELLKGARTVFESGSSARKAEEQAEKQAANENEDTGVRQVRSPRTPCCTRIHEPGSRPSPRRQ